MFIFTTSAMAKDYPEIKGIYDGAPYADVAKEHIEKLGTDNFIYLTIPKEYIFDKDKLSGKVEVIIPEHSYYNEELHLYDTSQKIPESTVEIQNYIYIFRNSDTFHITDIYEEVDGVGIHTKEETEDFFKSTLENNLSSDAAGMFYYPYFEIVSINGIPWQETEFADFIISETKRRLKPGDKLLNDDLMWEIYVDPQYSGWAEDAYEQKLTQKENNTDTSKEASQESYVENQNIVVEQITSNSTSSKVTFKLGDTQVYVYGNNAKTNTLDAVSKAPDGYTLIPLRGILDELGTNLSYDGSKVTVENDIVKVALTPSSKTAVVNDTAVEMDCPAVVENGRILVPLRFVSEQLGYTVEYDSDTKVITINN